MGIRIRIQIQIQDSQNGVKKVKQIQNFKIIIYLNFSYEKPWIRIRIDIKCCIRICIEIKKDLKHCIMASTPEL
jgi:hypothetical protein